MQKVSKAWIRLKYGKLTCLLRTGELILSYKNSIKKIKHVEKHKIIEIFIIASGRFNWLHTGLVRGKSGFAFQGGTMILFQCGSQGKITHATA